MKVTIAGKAIVFTSAVKLDDMKRVAKYKPEALTIKEDDHQVFCAAVKDKSVVSKTGIFFDGADEAGYACATLLVDEVPTKDYVVENFATAVARMNQLEAAVAPVLEGIAQTEDEVFQSITQL